MRIQAVVLSAALLCGAVWCGAIEPAEAVESGSPATVWYAPGTQKIRPDVAAEEYANCKMDQFAVKTGRSEYESAQIIMTGATSQAMTLP